MAGSYVQLIQSSGPIKFHNQMQSLDSQMDNLEKISQQRASINDPIVRQNFQDSIARVRQTTRSRSDSGENIIIPNKTGLVTDGGINKLDIRV